MAVQKDKIPFGFHYLEWIPRIEDFSSKIRKWHFDKSVIEPIAYFIATLLLTGLVWFIFYIDEKNTMPPNPPEEPEHRNEAEADYDFQNLIKKQQEPDETFILRGSTDKYDWQQGMAEIDIFIPLPDEEKLSRKQVKVDFKSSKLTVTLGELVYMDGQLFDIISPEDCSWQIDKEVSGEGADTVTTRKLWISLLKKKPTPRNQFWTALLLGDKKVSVGPAMVAIDPGDPSSMRQAIDQVRSATKKKAN